MKPHLGAAGKKPDIVEEKVWSRFSANGSCLLPSVQHQHQHSRRKAETQKNDSARHFLFLVFFRGIYDDAPADLLRGLARFSTRLFLMGINI